MSFLRSLDLTFILTDNWIFIKYQQSFLNFELNIPILYDFLTRNRRGIILEGVSDSVLTGGEEEQSSFENSPMKRFYRIISGAQLFGMVAIDAFIGINYSPGVALNLSISLSFHFVNSITNSIS